MTGKAFSPKHILKFTTALFLLLAPRPSQPEKTFTISHQSVQTQIADVLIMVEMSESTTSQKQLQLMRTNTMKLLSQLQIGEDQVRVALIVIGEDKDIASHPELRKDDDYKGAVLAKLNEGISLKKLHEKVSMLKIYKYTPCSLAETAVDKVILQEKNGDRPDVPNILVFMASFCCDNLRNDITKDIYKAWQRTNAFASIITLVYRAGATWCNPNSASSIAKGLASEKHNFGFLENFNFKKIKILDMLKRAIACQQTVHVGDCDWNIAANKCARNISIDGLSNEKCKQAITKPYTALSYFGNNSVDCVEAQVAICPTNYKRYIQISRRVKIPKLDDENLDIDAQQDLIDCNQTQPFPTCPKATTTIPMTTTSFMTTIPTTESLVTTTAPSTLTTTISNVITIAPSIITTATSTNVQTTNESNKTTKTKTSITTEIRTPVVTTLATTASSITSNASLMTTVTSIVTTATSTNVQTSSASIAITTTKSNETQTTKTSIVTTSTESVLTTTTPTADVDKTSTDTIVKTWSTAFYGSTCEKANNDSCYSLLNNLENIDQLLEKGLKKMGCSIDAIDVQRNMNVEAKKKLCQDLDLMRICKPWLDKLELSPYDVCPDAEDGYYRSLFATQKESKSSDFPWWILAVVFVICLLIILLVVIVLVRRKKQKKSEGRAIASKATKNLDRSLSAEISDQSAASMKNTGLGNLGKTPSAMNKQTPRPKSKRKSLEGKNVTPGNPQKDKLQEKEFPNKTLPVKVSPKGSGV